MGRFRALEANQGWRWVGNPEGQQYPAALVSSPQKRVFFFTALIATLPTCGPPLILPPALRRWGPPRRQGLCSHLAHLWATSDSAPRSEAVGTPQAAGVM